MNTDRRVRILEKMAFLLPGMGRILPLSAKAMNIPGAVRSAPAPKNISTSSEMAKNIKPNKPQPMPSTPAKNISSTVAKAISQPQAGKPA